MKVLHVIGDLQTGGAEKLLVDLMPLLALRVEKAEVAVFRQMDTTLEKRLSESGIMVHYLDKRGVYYPGHICAIRRLMRHFDLVHVHNMPPQLYVAIASIGLSCPIITTEHTTTSRHRAWWFAPVERWMYSRYAHVICISPATQQTMLAVAGPHTCSSVIPNGIYLNDYPLATFRHSDTTPRIITMVGRLSYQKDQATLVRAMTYLSDDTMLWLVGDGDQRAVLQSLIAELNLTHRVRMWGTRSDAPLLLQQSAIAVQSSHIEGFGLAAVEAMACGLPVVASRVQGLDSVVEGAGLLFEHGNAEQLAEQLSHLLADADFYHTTAQACLDRSKLYDIHRMADGYVGIYEQVLQQ